MPPEPIFDLHSIDLNHVAIPREEIYRLIPQRHEFEMIDGFVMLDTERIIAVAYRDIRADEWWCKGHLPGRPIFPGVLMVETAAQIAAYCDAAIQKTGRFMAFGGIDEVKFRGIVTPPARIYFIGRLVEMRPRRTICAVQGFVNDKMVFEGKITGLPID